MKRKKLKLRKIDLSSFDSPEELKELIIEFNKGIVEATKEPFIIVNEGQLDSAIGQVFQSWYDEEQALAALFKSLILNHPFMNGNKRVAFVVLLSMADIKLNPNELKNLTYIIASEGGSSIEVDEITNVLFGTTHEVTNPKLDMFLDYDDEEEEEELTESTDNIEPSIIIELKPNILLELYEELFITPQDNLEPVYDYTEVSKVWAELDLENNYPEYWDLHVVINGADILWDFLESSEIENFVLSKDREFFKYI